MTPPISPADATPVDSWLDMLQQVARHYGLPNSGQVAKLTGLWAGLDGEQARVRGMARALGLSVRFRPVGGREPLTGWRLPMIVRMADGALALVTAIGEDGEATLTLSGKAGHLSAHTSKDRPLDSMCFIVDAISRLLS